MNATDAEHLRSVEGRQFPESLLMIIGWVFLGVFVMGPIGGFVVVAWWNEWSLGTRRISWYGALLGAVGFALGLLSPLLLEKIFRREIYIIGQEFFQVVRGDSVEVHVPYGNIARIDLVQEKSGDSATAFIGIMLTNIDDPATYCPATNTPNPGGYHLRIQKGMRSVPLSQILELIQRQIK